MFTKIILIASILVNISQSYFKGPSAVNNYDEAATYCQSKGTTLASIVAENEWNNAKDVCGSSSGNCWIGLRDNVVEGHWKWDDHSDIATSYGFKSDSTATKDTAPWNEGEPNNIHSTGEDCVFMYQNTGYYNDDRCVSLNKYPLCNDGMTLYVYCLIHEPIFISSFL